MNALEYNQKLIGFESTSNLTNAPVADYVEMTIQRLGFTIERIEYDDPRGVRKVNIIAKRGEGTGGMAYFAHTDVVPADDWNAGGSGPFVPAVRDGKLYGRGSCDMKGSLACMLGPLRAWSASARSSSSAS